MADLRKMKTMELIDHIFHRPETYIGSVEPSEELRWIVDDTGSLVQKKFVMSPALMKPADELICNGCDNAMVSKLAGEKMRYLSITVDEVTGRITVENDGKVVPTGLHESHRFPGADENTSIPHVAFGIPLAGTNFDDGEQRVWAGRNGLGAKCANIFSDAKEGFTVEILDPANETLYTQTWTDHMKSYTQPVRKKTSKKRGYTKVSFVPAFDRFAPGRITDDVMGLLRRRAHETTAWACGRVRRVHEDYSHIDSTRK
jgi:DNA topoisomerase-2